jgi:hypothetical protein
MMYYWIDIPRWLLLGLIAYAPWAYGSIPSPWRDGLIVGSHLVVGLWLLTVIIRRRLNYLNLFALFWALLILIQGFWMTYNSKFVYDNDYNLFYPFNAAFPQWPGSIDQSVSWSFMIQVSAFLGISFMACEISQNPIWRHRLLLALCWTGVSIIFLGLSQHLMDFLLLYPKGINVWPFATYYYHGNAGAYMNLVLPLMIGKLLICFRNQENHLERSLWTCVAAIAIAGPFINASKGATPIAILILLIWSVWQIKRELFHLSHAQSILTLLSLGLILTFAFAFLIYVIGPQMAIERWTNALSSSGQFARGRILTSEICLKMSAKSGAWGLGPDTFHIAFPFFTNEYGNKLYGFWRYAHMDYLQTLVEWGWIGCTTWGMFFLGGTIRVGWNYLRFYEKYAGKDRILTLSLFLALAGLSIHMFYDFPMQIPSIQFYALLILGMAYGSCRWATED